MGGHPVQDVATTVYYLRVRDLEHDDTRLEDAYRRGYETVAPWPAASPAQLDALVARRGLLLANTVLASPDPAERAQADEWIPVIGARLARWVGA